MQLWAIARMDFHLTTDEWMAMTPKHFQAIARRNLVRLQREEMLGGIIASTIANTSYWPRKSAATPWDFMFTGPLKRPEPKRQTTAEMFAIFDRQVGVEKSAGRIK